VHREGESRIFGHKNRLVGTRPELGLFNGKIYIDHNASQDEFPPNVLRLKKLKELDLSGM